MIFRQIYFEKLFKLFKFTKVELAERCKRNGLSYSSPARNDNSKWWTSCCFDLKRYSMSFASKAVLYGTIAGSIGTILFVHYRQEYDRLVV